MDKPPVDVIILYNKKAGGGGKEKRVNALCSGLRSEGHRVRIEYTIDKLHPNELAGKGEKNYWLIMAGGDGTLHHATNLLHRESIDPNSLPLLSVFPIGSGNDWASQYNHPGNPGEWIKKVRSGNVKKMECGLVKVFNGDKTMEVLLWNSAGMGITGKVVEELEEKRKRGIARANYLLLTLKKLFSYTYPTFILEKDREKLRISPLTINIGTGSETGGGMKLFPQAKKKGELKCTIVHKPSLLQIPGLAWNLYFGDISTVKSTVNCHTFSSMVITSTDRPFFLEIDGEAYQGTNVKIELLEEKINFLLPAF